MGTILYDFLLDSFLFDRSLIDDRFGGIEEARLRRELRAYREFCLANLDEILEEAAQKESNLRVFSGVEFTGIDLLKQAAFYVDQFILPDPIFSLAYEETQFEGAMRAYLEVGGGTINRERLTSELNYLRSLTPLVAADYVKFLPVSYLFEPPDQVPVYFSENYFSDALPKELMKYFYQNVIVESLVHERNRWLIKPPQFPCRSIAIRFKDHDDSKPYICQLFAPDIISMDDDTGVVEFAMYLPDEPPKPDFFQAWLFQSINRSALEFHRRVISEVALGAKFEASYLSSSPFVFGLLGKSLPLREDLKTHTLNTFLNLELPFLDNVNLETLMYVRQKDGEAFENFRLELDRQLRDLRLERDPELLAIRTENAIHEICEVQLRTVQDKIRYLRQKALAEAVVCVGGLVGAVQTGGWSVIASAIALAKGYETYIDYQQNVKQNPTYFLWQVLGSSKSRKRRLSYGQQGGRHPSPIQDRA